MNYVKQMIASSASLFSSSAGDAQLFDEAVGLSYAAAAEPALRRRLLSVLTQLFGACGALYLAWDRARAAAAVCEAAGSLPDGFAATYAAERAAGDPRRRFLDRGDDQTIFVSGYDRDNADPASDAFFDGFLRAAGVAHSLGASLAGAGACRCYIFIERALDAPPFAAGEIRLFRRIVGHLARAERLAIARRQALAEEALPRRILDRLALGIVVVDVERVIVFANAAAATLLAAGDGVKRQDGRLAAARAFETNTLAAALRRAAAAPLSAGDGNALAIARGIGRRPLALVVAPLPAPPLAHAPTGDARIAVFIADAEEHPDAALPARLAQLFGLSKAEARIAARVVEGRRLPAIAEEFAVRLPTVRAQLREVLRKSGVARQADLVRVALALPPLAANM